MNTFTSFPRVIAGLIGSVMVTVAAAQSAPPPGKSLAASAGLFAYPAKGQTAEKQTLDEGECYSWAKEQSGYDPASPPPSPAPAQAAEPAQPAQGGQRARGAVKGAAAGAVIGEVADNDASQGAATGAAVGAIAGGRQARQAKAQQQQQAQAQAQASTEQAKAAQQELAASFKRGMSACLESRGYTVK